MDRYFHLTVRAYRAPVSLCAHEVASWVWDHLREAFPRALTALLMPNHPHLITPARDGDEARRLLAHVLGGLRRSHNPGAALRCEPVPPPILIKDEQELGRQMRYTVLNPSRAGFVDDPLSWPWSTHRDVVGAIADPWVTGERLGASLGPRLASAQDIHAYVSGDPSVAIAGTPFPFDDGFTDVSEVPLLWVMQAAASATRGCVDDVRARTHTRRAFVQLAHRAGWRDTGVLAAACNTTTQAVRDHLRQAPRELGAAALCLSDARLRVSKTYVMPRRRKAG
ncbi:MAG TPA: hypothetical protein VFB62_26920 [Polyangiaceae bacterium]|nr:hypothetical protein [Polyangiaceae bacterium]